MTTRTKHQLTRLWAKDRAPSSPPLKLKYEIALIFLAHSYLQGVSQVQFETGAAKKYSDLWTPTNLRILYEAKKWPLRRCPVCRCTSAYSSSLPHCGALCALTAETRPVKPGRTKRTRRNP